ncbi:MAG: homoserine kinase [Oligoflexia bacterium]|nr:homoserine kinase [Oligoflexia bacterium]
MVTAFAPATVSNVAVGFDILGFPIEPQCEPLGDYVTIERDNTNLAICVQAIHGVVSDLPYGPLANTATVALLKMQSELKLNFGMHVTIKKGIAKGSGLGGSAASAVAAVVAANHLLERPLPKEALLAFALAGEVVASGTLHADNVGPSLLGGLQLIHSLEPIPKLITLPIPQGVKCVLVHPKLEVATKMAREVLAATVPLHTYVQQSALLASFIAACYRSDFPLLKSSLQDLIIAPQRAHLIPNFYAVQAKALEAGAMGCSISGAGPTIFSLVEDASGDGGDGGQAERVRLAMVEQFTMVGLATTSWIGEISTEGARVVDGESKR